MPPEPPFESADARASAARADPPRGAGTTTDGDAGRDGGGDRGYDPARDLHAALTSLAEAGTYLRQFIAAKFSGVLYGVKKLALLAVLGSVAGLAGATFVVTSMVILVIGLGLALAAAMPDGFEWVGFVVIGLLGLLISIGGLWLVLRMLAKAGRRSAVEQYKRDLAMQRLQFGHDAFSRAAARAAAQAGDGHRAPHPADTAAAGEAERQIHADFEALKR